MYINFQINLAKYYIESVKLLLIHKLFCKDEL